MVAGDDVEVVDHGGPARLRRLPNKPGENLPALRDGHRVLHAGR
jgi:hypothetical protein